MKSSRIFLLFLILSVAIISSFADEEVETSKDDTRLENKKKSSTAEKSGRQRHKNRKQQQDLDEVDDTEDYNGFLAGYADNRYTASHGGENNFRTRSRWPQQLQQQQPQPSQEQMTFRFLEPQINEWDNADEWAGIEFPNPAQVNQPPMPFNNPQASDNGQTCHSLVDQQYPVFSDVCGAVPQARYSLPNAFGHHERWQIAQLLTNIVSTSSDSSCTRSLRLLLCPVLFPPCQSRQDTPPVLPCQSYCRAIKSRCSIPALDALPCESLPIVSDICPTNQAYGSFLPSAGQPPLNQQQPSSAGLQATNYQLSRALASLQSILASQGLQSQLNPSLLAQQSAHSPINPSLLSQQSAQSPIHPSLLSQQAFQSPLNPSVLSQQGSQINQQRNSQSLSQQQQQQPSLNSRNTYTPEALSAIYAELSGQTNGYPYAQNQRYPTALTRPSVNEARTQQEARFGNLAFPRTANPSSAIPTGVPSGIPSLVKA